MCVSVIEVLRNSLNVSGRVYLHFVIARFTQHAEKSLAIMKNAWNVDFPSFLPFQLSNVCKVNNKPKSLDYMFPIYLPSSLSITFLVLDVVSI